jgi:hypothetical protein
MKLEEMEQLLNKLGIETASVKGSEILAICPGHKRITGREDKHPSWWVNADTGQHICFACGFKGGLWSLIAERQGFYDSVGRLDYADAKDWFYESFDSIQLDVLTEISTPIQKEPEVKITEASLAIFSEPPAEALRSRGLSAAAAKHHQLLWDSAKKNWIILIRDPYSNKLLGWQEKGFAQRFFRNYPPGMEKSKSLFGLSQYQGGRMIVVESPLDVVRLTSLGIPGGVATYGVTISTEQLKLIREADEVVFALDNDDAGRANSAKLLDLTKALKFEAWFFNYSGTDRKDIGAMSRSEVDSGLQNARHCVYGVGALTWHS